MLTPALRELASLQHGALSRSQVMSAGASDQQLRRAVRRGLLARVHPNTFVVAGSPRSPLQELLAGLLELGPTAVVSHRSAGALFGFDGFDAATTDHPELTFDRPLRRSVPGLRIHTTSHLDPIDRARVADLPCTSATRTIIDLAGSVGIGRLEAAIGSALRDGLTSLDFLHRRLDALRGVNRRGAARLDRVLREGHGAGNSHLERQFLRLVARAGLPRPRCQVSYRRDGAFVARVDFTWEPEHVVVEVAGQQWHAGPAERQRDAQRQTELQLLGFLVLTFTYQDVNIRPAWVVARCREALTGRRRAAHVEDSIGS